jgi:hypothetical protein
VSLVEQNEKLAPGDKIAVDGFDHPWTVVLAAEDRVRAMYTWPGEMDEYRTFPLTRVCRYREASPFPPTTPQRRATDLKPRVGKAPLALLPRAGLEVMAAAMEHGALKYWPGNWRNCPLDEVATYRHALLRHATAFCMDNEALDPESGVPHLGHIMACCAIIAHVTGMGYEPPLTAQQYPDRLKRLASDQAIFGGAPGNPSPSELKDDPSEAQDADWKAEAAHQEWVEQSRGVVV